MCSVVILYRPDHPWPLILGANRDEMESRPSAPPARHWPDRTNVVAGLDRLAGGSWLGLNDEGVVACIMNRMNTLGPAPGRRSRGELVLEALDHADAVAAAEALRALDPAAYRAFNMVIADNRDALWLRNLGHPQGWVEVQPLPPGLSMITAHDLNDTAKSPRIRTYLPRFASAAAPDPEAGDWRTWESLLSSGEVATGAPVTDAMAFTTDTGFATVSSSLLALPAVGRKRRPIWRFAPGRPDQHAFADVKLG
jgi:uncharacterized protein with NRDE domain